MTIALHSVFVQATFVINCCNWAREYSELLLVLERDLQLEIIDHRNWPQPGKLKDLIEFYKSVLRGQTSNFRTFKERANLQVNLLYSIINQQDSIQNRWDSRLTQLIAKSQKQDSISMTTFTFITALFLPGTFMAALFSMTMFHWSSESQLQSRAVNPDQTNVASSFWIFWAITIPLTLLTMLGWYLWFRYAQTKWSEELRTGLSLRQALYPMHPQNVQQDLLAIERIRQPQPIVYPNSMDPRSNLTYEDIRFVSSPMPDAFKFNSNYQQNSFARWFETGEGTNIFALPATADNVVKNHGTEGGPGFLDVKNSLFTMHSEKTYSANQDV